MQSQPFRVDVPKLAAYLADIAEIQDHQCINKRTGRRIKAIIPVHIFGHPSDMMPLKALCEQYHLTMIEDATPGVSLGSYYQGIHTGHSGETACLSFNGNKIITTGGGGAILTNNTALAQKAKHISSTAKQPHRFDFYHDEIGYNYRLPNINAALGCAQLEMLPEFLEKKRALALRYQAAFEDNPVATVLKEPAGANSNYWLNAIILKAPNRAFIEAFMPQAASNHYRG